MYIRGAIIITLLLPLISFVVLGLFGRRTIGRFSGGIAATLMLLSTVFALMEVSSYVAHPFHENIYPFNTLLHFTWLSFGPDFSIDMSFLVDPISLMMIFVVTLVSLMVHLFSLGYMKGETRYPTYFAFLGLFTFSMLGLVLSANLLQMYMFWELVGCSSYLLIGFYYDRPSAVAAAKKAFIVTRFADLGFLVGILILCYQAKTGGHENPLNFRNMIGILNVKLQMADKAMFLGFPLISWGLFLVFIGGAGKSALFPLHIWLPDAMEGPTPVSALIHAATMVVAGVFLVARLFPLYAVAIDLSRLIMYVGAISALLAAIIACTQTDIKRVLAYSTMSQIGYMMFALGTAPADYALGFTASMFHLFTHAFFKALLFLCAGVIIHHVHSNEMKDMGGLRKQLPLAHGCFLIACLAIAGIPPFSGFFSKEEILLAAWKADKFIYAIGLFTSGLTAFYMFRLYFSVFWNRPATGHRHKLPFVESLPLILLALGAVFAGFIPFSEWVPADRDGIRAQPPPGEGIGLNAIPPVLMALTGIAIAARLYYRENDRPAKTARSFHGLYTAAVHKFYLDELYLFFTKKIVFNFIGRPAAWIDRNIVDGSMNGLASLTARISATIKGLQSGKIQDYAWFFFIGIAGLAVLFIYIIT
jgi:NADH-quinone oxidoreductase subunit L